MQQTSPDILAKQVKEFPALKGYIDPVRHDGVPMTIQVVVKRADTEFMGFRPSAIDGPACFLHRNGMVGCMFQEVIPVHGNDHLKMERFHYSHREPGSIRDLFRGRGPDFYSYFLVVTDIKWYGLVPETYHGRKPDPRGALLHVERRIDVRIAPSKAKGGFARLLNETVHDAELYFCIDGYTLRRHFPHHWRRMAESLEPLTTKLNDICGSSLSGILRRGSRNGVLYDHDKTDAVSTFSLKLLNDIALVGVNVSPAHAEITAFRGTVDNVLAMIQTFVG